MKSAEISSLVMQAIAEIAPDVDLLHLKPDVRFRDQFDFDSVDFVNLVEQLQQALKVKIPEIDYPQLTTLNGCVAYLGKLPVGD